MKQINKTGIIVARFQTSYLHEGHIRVLRYVSELNQRVILFLGTTAAKLTFTNPLCFEARKQMVLSQFPNIEIYELPDHKYDSVWDTNLDAYIDKLCPANENVILYGDRASFIEHYAGKYRKEYCNITISGISATKIRIGAHMCVIDSRNWRAGVIWASANRYPTSFQAVDVAVINFDKKQLLLGRKTGEDKYRFVGGFVDAADKSLEAAAQREVREECGDIETGDYQYIGSYRANDWRYRNEKDKVMTALFCAHYIFGHPTANDDIAEVKWFDIDALQTSYFEPEHGKLFEALKKYLAAYEK